MKNFKEKKIKLPFKNIKSEGWLNIALVAVLTLYIIQIGFAIINNGICMEIGIDYCAFWSAGRIINDNRFADIYDLKLLATIQKDLYPHGETAHFEPFGILYLPLFLIPFKYLSTINPLSSYIIWTIINLIGVIFYLRFFTKQMTGHFPPIKLIFLIMLSFPFFGNLKDGQVNFWLVICVGEFMRAYLSNKPSKAGYWLGGLLLKPQLLILILPFLLIKREFKVIVAFIGATIIALLLSLFLIGHEGLLSFSNMIIKSAKGGAESNPFYMINWRMLASHIEYFSGATIGWAIIILGTIATLYGASFPMRKKLFFDPINRTIELLGIFSATCAITWHAHLHIAVFLIPALLYLVMLDQFSSKLLLVWFFVPILAYFGTYIIIIVVNLLNLSISVSLLMAFSKGFPGLIVNLIILSWVVFKINHIKRETPQKHSF